MGLGNSAEKHGTLPFAHTDFIFAPLGEEFGFYGTMFVLLCYFLMTYAGIGVAMQCRDTYGRFLAVGIVAIIFCPAILNIAVVTNAVPNSGLPLPFISFGAPTWSLRWPPWACSPASRGFPPAPSPIVKSPAKTNAPLT